MRETYRDNDKKFPRLGGDSLIAAGAPTAYLEKEVITRERGK